MFIIFILFLFILIFLYCLKNHVRIDIKSFFKKGLKLEDNIYGVYCYTGKQGEGKTTGLVTYLLKQPKDIEIYSNMSLKGIKYKPINGFNGLMSLKDKRNIIIVFDEIFTLLSKKDPKTSVQWAEFLPFLAQMRKRHIKLLTTAQEWLEIDLTFRRYCRFQIQCHSFNIPFFRFGILKKTVCNVDDMIFNKEIMEYEAPPILTLFTKYSKDIVKHFDTYEVISTYNTKKIKN